MSKSRLKTHYYAIRPLKENKYFKQIKKNFQQY